MRKMLILVANRKVGLYALSIGTKIELLFLTFGEFRGIWQILARWRWRCCIIR